MGEDVVDGALAADGVIHVLGELVLKATAGGAKGGIEFVGVELRGEAEGELVGSDGEFEFAGKPFAPAGQIVISVGTVAVEAAEFGEEGFEEGVGSVETAVKIEEL